MPRGSSAFYATRVQGRADGGNQRGRIRRALELGDGGEREDAADDRLPQVGEVRAAREQGAGDVAQNADAIGQGGGDEKAGGGGGHVGSGC